jgi:hypothetical protein
VKSLGLKLTYVGPWNGGTIHLETDSFSELTKAMSQLSQNNRLEAGSTVQPSLDNSSSSSGYPSISGILSCAGAIRALLSSNWGRVEGRTEAELTVAMKASAVHYPRGTISGLLTAMTRRGELRRIGKKMGSYAYVFAGPAKDDRLLAD